jgi:hypothetical protein
MDNNTTPDRPHFLDALIWNADTWVAEFNALLDALDVQFAIESELSDLLDGDAG